MKITSKLATLAAISFCILLAGCPQQSSGPYKITNTQTKIEFEDITPSSQSSKLNIELDETTSYPWSEGKGLLFSSPKAVEYVIYQLAIDDDASYSIKFYGFKNRQYGRYRIAVNDKPTGKLIDFFGHRGQKIDGYDIGTYKAEKGIIKIAFALAGAHPRAQEPKYGAAFDYMTVTRKQQ